MDKGGKKGETHRVEKGTKFKSLTLMSRLGKEKGIRVFNAKIRRFF